MDMLELYDKLFEKAMLKIFLWAILNIHEQMKLYETSANKYKALSKEEEDKWEF